MPHLVSAISLLICSVAADGEWLASRYRDVLPKAAPALQHLRSDLEKAIESVQASSVDMVLVGLTDDALEDLRVASPARWQARPGQCALTPKEAAAIWTRLNQIAGAGHAKALGRYEIVLRPGEQLGLATHRQVKLIDHETPGVVAANEFLISTIPTIQLQKLDLVTHQLKLRLRLSMSPSFTGENLVDTLATFDRLIARDGETLMILRKSPYSVDWHANEGGAAADLPIDVGHRLLLMTPQRRARPDKNGAIVLDRGAPKLGITPQ